MPNTVECKEDDSEKEAPLYGMTIDDLHGSNRIWPLRRRNVEMGNEAVNAGQIEKG
jgi:hypothetical protein